MSRVRQASFRIGVIAFWTRARRWQFSASPAANRLTDRRGRLRSIEAFDPRLAVAKRYSMLPADAGFTSEGRMAATNQTVRTVFVVGLDKKIKLMMSYPMSTSRNFDEVLRVLDSLQLTAKHQVSTPVNWKNGDDVIISGSVTDEKARVKYPGGWKAPEPYLRIVPQPK